MAPVANEARSLILMSGTLAPLLSTLAELGPTFGQRALPPFQAGHVIPSSSLTVLTVQEASSTKFECTFKAWKRDLFLMALGSALVQIVRAIPGGVLVFFPSFDLLDRCTQAWQRKAKKRRGAVERVIELDGSAIWEQLLSEKRTIVTEPPPSTSESRDLASSAYTQARQQYENSVRRDGQALLLAVYRGRMSEGVSFDDDFARGVVCMGMPFPNITEEKLKQKRLCNDFWLGKGLGSMSGDDWYESRAMQAVAQALGRCIRHPRDYGALVLLDCRWSELNKAATGLPLWLQPFLFRCHDVGDAVEKLRAHFLGIRSHPLADAAVPSQSSSNENTGCAGSVAPTSPVRTPHLSLPRRSVFKKALGCGTSVPSLDLD